MNSKKLLDFLDELGVEMLEGSGISWVGPLVLRVRRWLYSLMGGAVTIPLSLGALHSVLINGSSGMKHWTSRQEDR